MQEPGRGGRVPRGMGLGSVQTPDVPEMLDFQEGRGWKSVSGLDCDRERRTSLLTCTKSITLVDICQGAGRGPSAIGYRLSAISIRLPTSDFRPPTRLHPARQGNGKPDQHEDSDCEQGGHRMSPRVARSRRTPAFGITDATGVQISDPQGEEGPESPGRVDRAHDQPYPSILKAWCVRPGKSLGRTCEDAPGARFTNHVSGERVSGAPHSRPAMAATGSKQRGSTT